MNESQAREIRKLKVEQDCSYPTIARKFHQEFGETDYCNKDNAESVLYFDLDNIPDGVQVHKFKNGPMPINDYKLVEYLFSPDVGKTLCLEAKTILNEFTNERWLDFEYNEALDKEYEEST